MMVSNRNLLFQGVIFRCHVSFREGKCANYDDHERFLFPILFYSNFVEKIPWVDHKTKTESFKKTGPCQEKHRGFPKSSFSPPPQKHPLPWWRFALKKMATHPTHKLGQISQKGHREPWGRGCCFFFTFFLAGPTRREWGSLNLYWLVYWGWNFPKIPY